MRSGSTYRSKRFMRVSISPRAPRELTPSASTKMMDAFLPELALLPAGLHDLLPPDAEREAGLVDHAMAEFRAYGYEQVKPPLLEFEESLLSGVGRAWALETFRLLDPGSQRMMGLRADMTLQI